MTTPIPLKSPLGVSVLALLIPAALSALQPDAPPTPPPIAAQPPSFRPSPLRPCPKARSRDTLDCLLNDCYLSEKSLRDDGRLTKGDIVHGMSKIKNRVGACYRQFQVPGMANVSVTIAQSGQVTQASVSGSFAGTPTGDCVQDAVRAAGFPPSKQQEIIDYPFMLR